MARLEAIQRETIAVLLDVSADHLFTDLLLSEILNHDRIYRGITGELVAAITDLSSGDRTSVNEHQTEDHSITLKLFNFVEAGIHPDVEIRQFLDNKKCLQLIVPLVGQLEYRRSHAESMTIATLQPRLQSAQSGWSYSLKSLYDFFECTT
ncbi:MAG: alpha-amylase, partial [Phormidesmis sp. CAN_BIN36]|nr:alpha-amylase [Phormidesmis sp. CAN_BIN36]